MELGRTGGRHVRPWIYRRALASRDPEIRAAAVRGLAPLAPSHDWAIDLLVLALRKELIPRSRVAAHLDLLDPHLAQVVGELIDDDVPAVRYWAALLLARYPGQHAARLERCLRDADAAVRRAAVETLGVRGERASLPAVLALLDDEAMFVRAHACRSAGRLGGVGVAARIVPLLGDREWWVRAAAKDTLRGLGDEVLATLLPVLESPDRFARNGAAEVLQDLRLVDRFAASFPDAPLVQAIYDAGEDGLRRAAEARIHDDAAVAAEREAA